MNRRQLLGRLLACAVIPFVPRAVESKPKGFALGGRVLPGHAIVGECGPELHEWKGATLYVREGSGGKGSPPRYLPVAEHRRPTAD
jgi:hypothetical protein